MKEWRQTFTSICTLVLAIAALATLMQFQFAAIRAEMGTEHAEMRAEHAEIRSWLSSVDRRAARIEGHLFGVEVAPDQQANP